MNTTQPLKLKIAASLLCLALLIFVSSASAAVLLTDNFDVVSGNSQNLNQDLAVRQGGPLALATYSGLGNHHQVGNTGTDVGQPGGPSYGGYVLTAFNGNWQSDLNIAAVSSGPLTIDFDMYEQTNSSSEWGACSLRAPGSAFPVAGSTEFGFLRRRNGGVQVFQNGNVSGTAAWDTANFALAPHWTLIFTDTAGTGSAFSGNGSKVTMINGTLWTNTLTLGQLKRSGLKLGFNASGGGLAGIDNLVISGTQPAISVTATNQSGANPFTPTYTPETPNLIAGLAPTTATGNFNDGSCGGTPTLTDGAIGVSGSQPGFASCGQQRGNTLIYTLTNVVNGTDVTNIVVYSGWADGGRYGQYYDLSYSTIAAPTTYIPITTVFSLIGFKDNTGDTGNAPATRVTIHMANGTPLASGVANIKFDFSSPPNSSSFNNGWQGYSEIVVQGNDTAAPPPPPSPVLSQDTLPTYAETVVGDQVVFTAAYSNAPPANLQWQLVTTGPAATNNINTGVANVTNNGVVTSTLTLNNVQLTDTGSYRLKADNATNGAAASSYTASRQLVVGSTPAPINNVIVNYAAQTFPSSISYFPAWPVDTNNLNLIYGFTSGSGQGTFTSTGDFTGGGNFCNADPTILSDGIAASMTSLPNLAFGAGGTLIANAGGQTITYTLVTNSAPFGLDVTNITVFGGWQDAGRDEQKYQVLYSTVQAPASFAPLLTVDYDPGNPGNNNQPAVTRTTLVPASGVLVHNVAVVKINWNLSPGPKNGWEGYSEILVGGQASTGFVPTLTSDVSPNTASDVVGSQIIITAAFSGADSMQWKKNGTNILGATTPTLTLNNLQLTNAGSYSLVASNAQGFTGSSGCAVTINPAPTAVSNIVTAIASQTSQAEVFTPTWDTNAFSSSLIYNVSPSSSGDGDFTGGNFGVTPTGGSLPPILTDGTFGTIDFNLTGTHSWVTCIGSGTGVNNAQGGNFVVYTLPVSPNGYDITNIMTAGGWNDGGRDQQSYTVNYATAANPTYFTPLAVVNYNPVNPVGYSMSRATITPASGVLASNVVALEFDMTSPAGENGFSGYSEIAAYGSPSATAPPAGPMITAAHEEFTDAFTVETPNLIANQLPSSFGSGSFTLEGCTEAGLTDGVIAFGGGPNSASCGAGGGSVPWIIFNSPSGWNLTNIVVYTLWHDYGRDGQFYNLSYSTLSAPTTFLPLATVAYNPPVPHDGRATGNRVAIAPPSGQTMLATNVYAVKFDFTPQGSQDFSWSGYSEIVLQGSNLPSATAPVVSVKSSGGNLILTGTGGTPNYAYDVLTTTNLLTPMANWTVIATDVSDGSGAISNAIPINVTTPASFFRVRVP